MRRPVTDGLVAGRPGVPPRYSATGSTSSFTNTDTGRGDRARSSDGSVCARALVGACKPPTWAAAVPVPTPWTRAAAIRIAAARPDPRRRRIGSAHVDRGDGGEPRPPAAGQAHARPEAVGARVGRGERRPVRGRGGPERAEAVFPGALDLHVEQRAVRRGQRGPADAMGR